MEMGEHRPVSHLRAYQPQPGGAESCASLIPSLASVGCQRPVCLRLRAGSCDPQPGRDPDAPGAVTPAAKPKWKFIFPTAADSWSGCGNREASSGRSPGRLSTPRLRTQPAVRGGRGPEGPGAPRSPRQGPESRRPEPRRRLLPPEAHTPLPQLHSPGPSAPPRPDSVSPRLWRAGRDGLTGRGRRPGAGGAAGARSCRGPGGARRWLCTALAGRGRKRRCCPALPRPPAATWGPEAGRGRSHRGGSPNRLRPLRPGLRGRFQGNLPTTINTPAAARGGPPLPRAACPAPEGRGWHAERCLGNVGAVPLPGTSLSVLLAAVLPQASPRPTRTGRRPPTGGWDPLPRRLPLTPRGTPARTADLTPPRLRSPHGRRLFRGFWDGEDPINRARPAASSQQPSLTALVGSPRSLGTLNSAGVQAEGLRELRLPPAVEGPWPCSVTSSLVLPRRPFQARRAPCP